jgi:hypothetical protein
MAAQLCRRCRRRPARFRVRGGRVRADRDHDVCFQCKRAIDNQQRAKRLRGR